MAAVALNPKVACVCVCVCVCRVGVLRVRLHAPRSAYLVGSDHVCDDRGDVLSTKR